MECTETQRKKVSIDSTFKGYGCTLENAKANFWRKVSDKANDELKCAGCTCPEGEICVPEVMGTEKAEQLLKISRVPLSGCPSGMGYKVYIYDQAGHSTEVDVRCTCVPKIAPEKALEKYPEKPL